MFNRIIDKPVRPWLVARRVVCCLHKSDLADMCEYCKYMYATPRLDDFGDFESNRIRKHFSGDDYRGFEWLNYILDYIDDELRGCSDIDRVRRLCRRRVEFTHSLIRLAVRDFLADVKIKQNKNGRRAISDAFRMTGWGQGKK